MVWFLQKNTKIISFLLVYSSSNNSFIETLYSSFCVSLAVFVIFSALLLQMYFAPNIHLVTFKVQYCIMKIMRKLALELMAAPSKMKTILQIILLLNFLQLQFWLWTLIARSPAGHYLSVSHACHWPRLLICCVKFQL